jgi:transposase
MSTFQEETVTLPVPSHAEVRVTLGIDTHADVHVAVALDQLGRRLGACTVATTPAGARQLLGWASQFGPIERVGCEGTSSWGLGLARVLRGHGLAVLDVNRPSRQTRRRRGKSDPVDAEAAARAVQAGTATTVAKTADGWVEVIRTLRRVRRSALKARTQAANQLQSLLVTAPDQLREPLRGLSLDRLVAAAAQLPLAGQVTTTLGASRLALRSVAVRHQQLTIEIAALGEQLDRLVAKAAPELVALAGVGTDTAATLLIAAGDNPERLRSEAAFAHLCGVAPIPASSGKTTRHRLHRGGNRDANRALWVIAMGRLRWDPRTRAYMARRTAEGKTKLEIIRCLIGGVSGTQPHGSRGCSRCGQGTAPMSCHPMASLSCAAPGRAEP